MKSIVEKLNNISHQLQQFELYKQSSKLASLARKLDLKISESTPIQDILNKKNEEDIDLINQYELENEFSFYDSTT